MAGNFGFFLKGMAGGIQSGFEMGWKKRQIKELEKKENAIIEEVTLFNNSIKQYGQDNIFSEDEVAMINTAWLALGAEAQERAKGTRDAIQAMKQREVEQDFQWFDLASGWTEGLDPKDAKGFFDAVRPNITSEKGKRYYDAYEKMFEAKYKAAQIPKEVTPYEFYSGSPASVQSQTAESVAGQTAGLGNVKFNQPIKAPKTELDVIGETQKKLDYAYATGNANYFNQMAKSLGVDTTFDTYKQGYKKPAIAPIAPQTEQNVEPEPEPIPEPTLLQKGVNAVKNWLNMKGSPQDKKMEAQMNAEDKITGYDEETEKSLIIEKIQKLNNKELFNELKKWGDSGLTNEEYYKLLYEEARRRGLVK